MPLRFVLDEHLRGPLWEAILRNNLAGEMIVDAIRVGDSADLPLGIGDREILAWAADHRRLLVTEDRRTMSVHLAAHVNEGQASPGVLMVRIGYGAAAIAECLMLIAHAGNAEEFANTISYIP